MLCHHNSLLCHCIYEWVVSFTTHSQLLCTTQHSHNHNVALCTTVHNVALCTTQHCDCVNVHNATLWTVVHNVVHNAVVHNVVHNTLWTVVHNVVHNVNCCAQCCAQRCAQRNIVNCCAQCCAQRTTYICYSQQWVVIVWECCVVHNSCEWHDSFIYTTDRSLICEYVTVYMNESCHSQLLCTTQHSHNHNSLLWITQHCDDTNVALFTTVCHHNVVCDDTTNVRCELCECCVIHNSGLWLCECCVVSSHIRCEMTLWWHNSHLTLWDSLWGVMTQRMWDVSCVNVALFTTVSCDCDVITTHCCVTVYMNESCHSHGWLNSFICVTCLIRTCDMPHWHEWGMSHIWTN